MGYDVATKLGVPWHAAPSVYGWAELVNFARHLPTDSATWRARHPDEAPWATPLGLAHVAAATYDAVMGVAHLLATRWSERRPPDPEPYPVPWARDAGRRRHVGTGSVTVAEFDEWWAAHTRD